MVDRAISTAAYKPAPEVSVTISGLNRVHKIIAAGVGAYRMRRSFTTRDRLLSLMSDGKPRSTRQVSGQLGVTTRAAESACCRYWKAGLLLRSEKPLHEANRVFAGRADTSYNTRCFYLYVLGNGGEEAVAEEIRFLSHSTTPRTVKPTKAQLVLNLLKENSDRAFYTTEIAARLEESGVTIRDVTVNLRRFEKNGRVYFRGYRNAEHETPFAAGYIVTYVDPNKPREIAIAEATERTELLLEGGSHANPLAERIRMIRDELLKAKKLKEIGGPDADISVKEHCKVRVQAYGSVEEGLANPCDPVVWTHLINRLVRRREAHEFLWPTKSFRRPVGGPVLQEQAEGPLWLESIHSEFFEPPNLLVTGDIV